MWRRIITGVFGVPSAFVKGRTGATLGDAMLAGAAVGGFPGFSVGKERARYVELNSSGSMTAITRCTGNSPACTRGSTATSKTTLVAAITPGEDQLMTADFSLSGGVALVTGAGSGIGRAVALGLADAGALVGCVDQVRRNVEAAAAEILAAGSRAVPVAADVTDPAAMSAAVAHIESALGPLTLGVNAAGIASAAPAESMPEEQWRQVIDVDLTGGVLVVP